MNAPLRTLAAFAALLFLAGPAATAIAQAPMAAVAPSPAPGDTAEAAEAAADRDPNAPPPLAARPLPQLAAATQSPVTVEARVEPARPAFGTQVELIITLRYPANVRTFFPGKPSLAPLLAIPGDPGKSERTEEPGTAGGVATVVEILRIPALVARTGLLRTPKIEVPWHLVTSGGGAGDSGTATAPSQQIEVQSAFGDDLAPTMAALPPAIPLVEDNTPLRIFLLILAMMALGGLLTVIGLRVLRDRLHRREPEPVIPPHIRALERIAALARSGRIEQEEPRLIYGEMSEILRAYLAGRYRFAALDMTSTELLDALQHKPLAGVGHAEFEAFTEEGDLVKFARQHASFEVLQARLDWMRRVVERTMQSSEDLERERAQQIAKLARQRKLRVQVMAPAQLRVSAFAIDAAIGAAMTLLLSWLAIDTAQRGLFDAAYGLMLLWMAARDLLGEGSPGKAILGLRIADWDPDAEVDPDSVLHDDRAARMASYEAQLASAGQRLMRNALLILPGAGVITEAITLWKLPELRRLGDQIARTRVIDGRYGLRRRRPTWAPAISLGIIALLFLVLPLLLGGRPQ